MIRFGRVCEQRGVFELAKNITVTEERIVLLSHLQRSASILGKENAIANLAVHGNELSVHIHAARSASDDLEGD